MKTEIFKQEVQDLLNKYAPPDTFVEITYWDASEHTAVGVRVAEVDFRITRPNVRGGSCVMQDDADNGAQCFWVERAITYRILAWLDRDAPKGAGISAQEVRDADWRMLRALYGPAIAEQFAKES